MNKTDLAYMAGFFDGEGSIYISTTGGHKYLGVSVGQANRWICEKFRFAFGGGVYKEKESPSGKQMWRWRATTRIAASFLKQIYPFLTLKQGEAKIALEFQQNRCYGKHKFTENDNAIIEAQRILLRSLKDKSGY